MKNFLFLFIHWRVIGGENQWKRFPKRTTFELTMREIGIYFSSTRKEKLCIGGEGGRRREAVSRSNRSQLFIHIFSVIAACVSSPTFFSAARRVFIHEMCARDVRASCACRGLALVAIFPRP
jgi:hypothetical protein